ncbi:MAG: transposase [Natronomonas sp.]|jgi:transposase
MGKSATLVIHAELGEIDRFDTAKEVVRYVGLNPVVRESGDSRFEGGFRRRVQETFGGCWFKLSTQRFTRLKIRI